MKKKDLVNWVEEVFLSRRKKMVFYMQNKEVHDEMLKSPFKNRFVIEKFKVENTMKCIKKIADGEIILTLDQDNVHESFQQHNFQSSL